jgi:hypothetical protein
MDLQAVLLAPKTNVSAMYYKTKLAVHNMTFFDLENKDGTCFIWNETQGKLSADKFFSIANDVVVLQKYLERGHT